MNMKKKQYKCKICNQVMHIKHHTVGVNYYYCPDCDMIYVVRNEEIVKGYRCKHEIKY